MARNSLGIITTPRVNIHDLLTGSAESYEDTEFEKVVDAIVKSINSRKLLCVDLYDSNTYDLFGIANLIYGGGNIYFICGALGSNIGGAYAFYINLTSKQVTIDLIDI